MKRLFYIIIVLILIELVCRLFVIGYRVKIRFTEDARYNKFSGNILDYMKEYLKVASKVRDLGETSVFVDDWLFNRRYYIPNLNMESPGFEGEEVGSNSWGFRGKEVPPDKGKDVYRMICLGSSYTLSGEDRSFAYFLEQKLNNNGKERTFEVINAGIPAQDILQSFMLFSLDWRKLNPDMVIIDNVLDSVPLDIWPFYLENYRANKKFFMRGRFYRTLCNFLKLQGVEGVIKIVDDKFHARRDEPAKEGLDLYESMLEALVLEAKGMGSTVVLLSCGIRAGGSGLLQDKKEEESFLGRRFFDFTARGTMRTIEEYNKIMERVAARNNAVFVDMSNVVPKSKVYYEDVTHRNFAGNEVFAAELFNRLVERKVLE
ncbi:MAG: SGNH/GDSL hydrolase family protein [Candidatus Omnitrophica bacterium]|nr:SGNH/GDSL hydrolase family protein [Candidatus Omnitrophota bacterium]